MKISFTFNDETLEQLEILTDYFKTDIPTFLLSSIREMIQNEMEEIELRNQLAFRH